MSGARGARPAGGPGTVRPRAKARSAPGPESPRRSRRGFAKRLGNCGSCLRLCPGPGPGPGPCAHPDLRRPPTAGRRAAGGTPGARSPATDSESLAGPSSEFPSPDRDSDVPVARAMAGAVATVKVPGPGPSDSDNRRPCSDARRVHSRRGLRCFSGICSFL